jgi:hypothetical protein
MAQRNPAKVALARLPFRIAGVSVLAKGIDGIGLARMIMLIGLAIILDLLILG